MTGEVFPRDIRIAELEKRVQELEEKLVNILARLERLDDYELQ